MITYEQARRSALDRALGLGAQIPVLDRQNLPGDPENESRPHGYALAEVSFGSTQQRGSRAGNNTFESFGTLTLMCMVPRGTGTAKLDRLRQAFELELANTLEPLMFRSFRAHDMGDEVEINKHRTDFIATFVRYDQRPT